MFRAEKSALAAALAIATQGVESRNTIPILCNVLIQRDGDMMRVTGSNLDAEVSSRFHAEISVGFQGFTCPAVMLDNIIKKLTDGAEVVIDETPDKITVKSVRSRFSLQTLPEADFPSMSEGGLPTEFTVNAPALSSAIKGVQFAICNDEARYYLNGIYLHESEGDLRLIATDGHRLAKRVVPAIEINASLEPFAGIIVPRTIVGAVLKLIDKQDKVTISLSQEKIRIEAGEGVIVSKLVDGTFPDYNRIIPKNNDTIISVEATPMLKSLERVTAISGERGRAVKLAFSQGTLRLSVKNPDAGEAEDEIAFDGDAEALINFNGKYVLDAVSHLGSEKVEIMMSDPGSPAILKQPGQSDDIIILMPMRV